MNRPTPEEIAEARKSTLRTLAELATDPHGSRYLPIDEINALRVLLAATEPPTDEEIAEIVAAHHRDNFPGNPFAGRASHQMKNLRTGDKTFTIVAVVGAIRHFFGPVKP